MFSTQNINIRDNLLIGVFRRFVGYDTGYMPITHTLFDALNIRIFIDFEIDIAAPPLMRFVGEREKAIHW